MKIPVNQFKQKLQQDEAQIGLWLGLANSYSAEIIANTGFDWLAIDAEHAPNNVPSVLAQLQVLAAYDVHPIVRPVQADTALIKQYLDLGAQTLLLPMVESAEQALQIVKACHYPPKGMRGVGSALARASRWNKIPNYVHEADAEICIIVQIESKSGLENLTAIAAIDEIDGIFFGPADLSASLGYLGNPAAKEVQDVISYGIATARKNGKGAGILSSDLNMAQNYIKQGANFVAIGVDTTLLFNAAQKLIAKFKPQLNTTIDNKSVY